MQRKYTTVQVLVRIFLNYIWPLKLHLSGAIIATFVVARCAALVIRKIEPSVNYIYAHGDFGAIALICSTLFVISLIRGIFEFLQNFCTKYMGHRILCNIQIQLFSILVKSDIQYIQNQPVGHILSRFTNDILRMKALFIAFFPGCFRHILLFGFLVVELIRMDAYLATILLSVIVIVGYLVSLIGKKLRAIEYVLQQKLAEYTTQLNQVFSSIKIVRAFAATDSEISNTNAVVEDVMQLYKNQIAYDSLTYLFVECASGIAVTSILLYWGQGYVLGGPGKLTAFIMAFVSLYRPFKGMMSLNFALHSGIAATIRVFNVIDEYILPDNLQKTEIFYPIRISLKNVKLTLQESIILNNCSLSLQLGEMVAIYGESGSGKSSLINLFTGYARACEGEVEIETNTGSRFDLKTVSEESLAKNISLVTQNPIIFYATIADNVSYGGNHSITTIKEVCEKVGAHKFINTLSKGYHTIIGHSGTELSLVEKQQISIARALIKNAPIILLDEAFEDLDHENARCLYKLLNEIKSNKIILVTTKTVPENHNFDRILFLQNSKLVTQI